MLVTLFPITTAVTSVIWKVAALLSVRQAVVPTFVVTVRVPLEKCQPGPRKLTTSIVKVLVASEPTPLLTLTVKVDEPTVVGVPVIVPVLELRFKPAGKFPAVTVQVKIEGLPVACKVWLYAVLTAPTERMVVVIVGAATILIVNCLVAFGLTPLLTPTVKVDEPIVVGVPVIAPVLELRFKPAGRFPAVTVQVKIAGLPVACRVWLYAVLIVPVERVVVVIVGAATILIVSCLVAFEPTSLLTLTVKVDKPTVVGVPVIAPVLELRFKPAGRFPAVTVQVKIAGLPVACRVWLYAMPMIPSGMVVVVIVGATGSGHDAQPWS
jgi:hypothetical protein